MVGLVVLVLGGVGIWPGAGPAGAVEQEPIKLTAPSSVTREYDALVGTVPVTINGVPGDARPNSCSQYAYCDSIPLQLSVPESLKNSDTEDYFLRIKVEWDNSSGNNLDAYMYDAPYEPGTAPIASSATANMPEAINLYRPDKPEYILTVMNRNGANSGYTVTAALTVEPFGGAPDFGGVNEGGGRPPTTSPPPSSGGGDSGGSSFDPEPSQPSTAQPPAPSDPGFEPRDLAPVDRDDSLSALARERGGFEGSLTAPPVSLPETQGPPPGPVSGAAVALLGGLLPASLVGGGVFLLRRKGGTATAGF